MTSLQAVPDLPEQRPPIKVFFSYSRKDRELRNELETHLSILKKQGVISTWHDREIVAGDEWARQIDEELEEADIILLLVSADFLASDYCYDMETTRAMERHEAGEAVVIPVILRPCDWQDAPFSKLLCAPTNGKPVSKYPDLDEAFLEITTEIKKAIQRLPGQHGQRTSSRIKSRSSGPVTAAESPRSSNLRLRQQFTDRDRDRYLKETFNYVARFFENSLSKLQQRNPGIEGEFHKIDANSFEATIYRDGKKRRKFGIWIDTGGRSFGDGIYYADGGVGTRGGGISYNDQLTAHDDGYIQYLTTIASIALGGGHEQKLSQQGAAEHFWDLFIRDLQ